MNCGKAIYHREEKYFPNIPCYCLLPLDHEGECECDPDKVKERQNNDAL